jgi:FKBP-type peptidyl-prolyl cis-trans isomerase
VKRLFSRRFVARRAGSAFGLVLLAVHGVGCSKAPAEKSSDFTPAQGAPAPAAPTKLEIEDQVVGTGREARTGDTIEVQYTGTLMNGEKFDSSYDNDSEPFKVTLGKGDVIKGWDQGIPGMKVGGKRRLRIPPDLGYGSSGSPPKIPPDAGLIFEIELVSID